jgi:endonuclease-8
MPEGDTIFRAARTLHRALAGQVVTLFETQLPHLARIDEDAPLAGRTVESVEAFGKWIHMRFSGGLTLVTHMLMSGSWHIYRPGEKWQRGRHQMRAAIHTQSFVAVAFQVPIAEFHTADSLRRHDSMTRLGPDVLSSGFDADAAADAIAARPELEVGAALLTQSILAGLGNVYKSEVCFTAAVNPFRPVKSLTRTELQKLMADARRLMLANVGEGSGNQIVTYAGLRRTTGRSHPQQRLWVYGRRGLPCRRCGMPIESRKQGLDARVTFWCPQCQPMGNHSVSGSY